MLKKIKDVSIVIEMFRTYDDKPSQAKNIIKMNQLTVLAN